MERREIKHRRRAKRYIYRRERSRSTRATILFVPSHETLESSPVNERTVNFIDWMKRDKPYDAAEWDEAYLKLLDGGYSNTAGFQC